MSGEPNRTRRWGRVLLVVSLALNLAVIGIVAGAALKFREGKAGPRFDLGVGPIARALSPEDRTAIRDRLLDSRGPRSFDRAGLRADMIRIIDVLRADQFETDVFNTLIARQQSRMLSGQDAVIAAVSAQIAAMTAQDRAAFADRLEQQLRRAPGDRSQDRSGGN